MESNELREAYIAAGLERNEHGQWFLPCDGGTPAYAYFEDDPALNPFAAELLTAKVRERSWLLHVEHDGVHFWNCADRTRPQTEVWSYGDDGNTLSGAIICAAMAVLKGGGE